MSQYLGDISAYALAVSQGYTGTEEEYAELMASYATVGQTAVTAAQTATTKASEAATSATTATNKASEATTAATTATNKAAEAQADADAAALDASQALSAASTATTKATEATTAAATAVSAKDDAVSANTAAQSAKTAAQTAQTGAEAAAASVKASAAQIATNAEDISQLKSDLTTLNGELLFDGSNSYAGGSENWRIKDLTPFTAESYQLAIKIYTNSAGVPIEVAYLNGAWTVAETITDDKWHIIDIPSGTTNYLNLTYRGADPVVVSCVIMKVSAKNIESDIVGIENNIATIEDDIEIIENKINSIAVSELAYGNNGEIATAFGFQGLNFSACSCKKTEKSGRIKSLYVKSYASGATNIYIGEVDQLLLFVPRTSFSINLDAGEKTYDISDRNIYINEGESVLIKFIGGQTPFVTITGDPEGDNSFYYNQYGNMQLEAFGAEKAAVFGFGYVVDSSAIIDVQARSTVNSESIGAIRGEISALQSTQNILSDRQGNKYKMIVQNGQISLLSMNFSHVLCVGNSYTVHPTTTDAEADYKNNLWWGHWSMAASSALTAWTKLLENALKQKNNDAVVTPVFGRRYETNPNTYGLADSRTFTYWTGSAWASLKDNVANFSDVDAIVFFLGANYSGDNWYTLYSQMVAKFLTWFPNATVFCCSTSSSYNASKDTAIQQVANEYSAPYISMVGIGGKSKIGSYVYGDDNALHQINNNAVANHFGDYGEYMILDRVCNAMGYSNNTTLRHISISSASGATISVVSENTISGAVITVFAEVASGTTLSSITVTDSSDNSVTVTDHGVTDYGRVFTFIMPEADVTITATTT